MTDLARPTRLGSASRRGRWPMTGALLIALLAASGALAGLFAGAAWWWALIGIGTLLLLVPAVLRTLGIPPLLASVADLALYLVVVAAAFGITPNPEGAARIGTLLEAARYAVEHDVVPATSIPQLLFLIVSVGGLVAILLDLLGCLAPALVGVILLLIAAAPAFFDPQGIGVLPLAGVALAYLLVLWADGRIRRGTRGGAGLVVIATSTALALGLTLLTPGLQQRWWQGAWLDEGAGRASSLVDLGRDLRDASPDEVLRFRTDRAPAPYLQLATLEDYDGTTWVRREGSEAPLDDGTAMAPPFGPQLGELAAGFEVEVEIAGLDADWAPAPYPAIAVEGGEGRWFSARNDYALRIDGAGLPGQDYRVQSIAIDAEPEAIAARSGGTIPRGILPDLELPDEIPQIILDTANTVVGGATTALEQAWALQAYLRSDGGFSYSTSTPDADSADGMAVVASFLERKSGFCVHFAAAMTVMARALGIPARIAIGYLPGELVDDGDGEHYSVSNRELHAWPQLYFAGAGWLAFEPTAGRGTPPGYSREPGTPAAPQVVPRPAPAPSSAPTRDPLDVDQGGGVSGATSEDAAGGAIRLGIWAGALVLVVALLLLPAAWRALRRRRRLRALASGGAPALAWAELTDTAADLGRPADPAQTPRAFGARLAASMPPDARDPLDALILEVERTAFGPPGHAAARGDLATLARSVLAGMVAQASRGQRLRARLAPRSLLGRRRVRRPREG